MPREPLLTRAFLLVFAAHFLHSLSYNLYLHLPGFLKERGAAEVEIGLLFGVAAGTAILARPTIGRVMDVRGRRPIILAGGALATLMCVLYPTLQGPGPWAYAVRVGHGLSEAMLFASLFTFAADIVPPSRRIEGIGLFGISGMLPLAVSGVLGDALIADGSYRALFLTSALFSGAALLLSLPLGEPEMPAGREPPRGIGAALAQRDLLPLWFIGLVFAAALPAYFTFLKTFVMESGVGSVGAFFSAYACAAVVVRLLFGSLPKRLGPKRVLFPALTGLALGLGLLAGAASPGALVAAGLARGAGHGFAFPILLGLVVSRARPSERGAALSIFTALFDGGTLLGGPLLGALIRSAGYTTMFAVVGACVVLGAAAFGLWDRRAPAAPDEGAAAA